MTDRLRNWLDDFGAWLVHWCAEAEVRAQLRQRERKQRAFARRLRHRGVWFPGDF
jgi:hypothetical protein